MDNDFAIESFIDYCDDMMIVTEGAQIDSFKVYMSKDMKNCKKTYKQAKKTMKVDPSAAIELFEESIEAALALKQKVNDIKDDAKKFRWLSMLNPLLIFINNEETTGIIPTGNGYIRTYKVYDDNMSKKAKNEMQVQIQQALNLHIKRCNEYINYIHDKTKKKLKMKK